MANDVYYNSVVLLLHCNGSNGSTTFTDNSPTPKTVTATGTSISTTSPKYGTGCLPVSGSGQYLTVTNHADFALGTGDFTIEDWAYVDSFTPALASILNIGAYNTGCLLRVESDKIQFFILGTSYTFATTISTGSYHHIAVCRYNGTLYAFLDGTLVGTPQAATGSIPQNDIIIGKSAHSASEWLNGRHDEIRITRGLARYTANFTVPASEFGDAQVVLAGNVTESLAPTKWQAVATRCADGVLAGIHVGAEAATTYSIACNTTDICNITLSPRFDSIWPANTAISLGYYVVPTNPDTTPKLYKCTTAGTTHATTEPTWPSSGTVNDGTAVWTHIVDLDDGMFKTLGAKIPA